MTEGFGDLGIRAELIEACEDAGYAGPTALQTAAIPVLRRGGNAVLHASAGAGVVAAYGLALLDRLAGSGDAQPGQAGTGTADDTRALVLVPTDDIASETAMSLARFARHLDTRVTALGPAWPGAAAGMDTVVAAPATALRAVEGSTLKLERLRSLVLDGASAILALDARDAIEALTGSAPRDAQRIVTTTELTDEVEDYIERHVRRALHMPARPAGREAMAEPTAAVEYTVATAAAKLDAIMPLLLEQADQTTIVFRRTAVGAAALADAFVLRGIQTRRVEGDPLGAVLAARGEPERAGARPVSYDVPFDADTLAARHAEGGLVVVEPREVPHLRAIAAEARLSLRAMSPVPPFALQDEVASYRDRLRQATREEDLAAQFTLLGPLLDEISGPELAAAASALLRRRSPAPPPAQAARPAAAAAPPARAWVRLFIGVGQRDGIRPGDLVGAITGETGAQGKEVGRIEIRDTFSIVEVTTGIAERAIQALNGTTIKGRSVRVDYDRKTGTAR